jgi:hypothetical protein
MAMISPLLRELRRRRIALTYNLPDEPVAIPSPAATLNLSRASQRKPPPKHSSSRDADGTKSKWCVHTDYRSAYSGGISLDPPTSGRTRASASASRCSNSRPTASDLNSSSKARTGSASGLGLSSLVNVSLCVGTNDTGDKYPAPLGRVPKRFGSTRCVSVNGSMASVAGAICVVSIG